MDIKSKLIGDEEERAVSPVIGVILMVAITVILAAVIAAFVLDMGDLDEGAPNAQFEWSIDESNTNDQMSVTHTSGEDIDLSNVEFTPSTNGDGDIDPSTADTWSAGQSINFGTDTGDFQIVWKGDDSSTIIAEHEN